jgi:hypothetical protein
MDDLRVRRPDALWLLQPEKSSGDLVVGDDRCRSSNPIASGASIEQHRPLNSSRRGSLGPPIRPSSKPVAADLIPTRLVC